MQPSPPHSPAIRQQQVFRSKKDVVQEALRQAIARGEYKPGERLVIDELAPRFGMSQIPVREALQQLQAEGFVEIQPHVGATVTRIEAGQITEIFELLESLELISGRAASSVMTDEDFTRVESMLREMDGLEQDLDLWSAANMRLHQQICDYAGMPLVKNALTNTLVHWDRVRRFYLTDVFKHRVHAAQREHWQMLRAMRAGDLERLAQIVRDHNRAARTAYTANFQKALQREAAALM